MSSATNLFELVIHSCAQVEMHRVPTLFTDVDFIGVEIIGIAQRIGVRIGRSDHTQWGRREISTISSEVDNGHFGLRVVKNQMCRAGGMLSIGGNGIGRYETNKFFLTRNLQD